MWRSVPHFDCWISWGNFTTFKAEIWASFTVLRCVIYKQDSENLVLFVVVCCTPQPLNKAPSEDWIANLPRHLDTCLTSDEGRIAFNFGICDRHPRI